MQDHDLKYFINYVYQYSTPYGILKNNLPLENMSSIFKESLESKNGKYYDDLFYPYLKEIKEKNIPNVFINFHHYHNLISTREDHTHLYIIQDYQGDDFNINPRFIERMSESEVYYVLFYTKKIENLEKFNKGINKFKKEFKLTKKHTCILSNSDISEMGNGFLYFNINDNLFEGANFINFIKENLAYKN
jgi:hypothetical protein